MGICDFIIFQVFEIEKGIEVDQLIIIPVPLFSYIEAPVDQAAGFQFRQNLCQPAAVRDPARGGQLLSGQFQRDLYRHGIIIQDGNCHNTPHCCVNEFYHD